MRMRPARRLRDYGDDERETDWPPFGVSTGPIPFPFVSTGDDNVVDTPTFKDGRIWINKLGRVNNYIALENECEDDESREYGVGPVEARNTRRKPFSRRNRRSTSLRRRYSSRSYSQGAVRLRFGGTTGMKPRSAASWRVSSFS